MVPKCFNVLKIVGRTLNVAVHAIEIKLFVSMHAHVTPVKWPLFFTVTPFLGHYQSKVVIDMDLNDTNPLKAQENFYALSSLPGIPWYGHRPLDSRL